jgi:CHAT domain-containing protein
VEDELFCWVVRQKSQNTAADINLVRIPVTRDFLGRKILEFRRMIQNLDPLDDLSKELFSLLFPGQVLKNLGNASKLGIIPHGPLHYLSFATLSHGNKFLIDDFSLFYLPSASVMEYTWKKRVEEKNLKVLAIGNPDLGDPVFDLPFSEHEVATIKWNFPDITVLTKELATEEWVADNIDRFGIIHMASHGEFNTINPLFSAIKLSGSKESALSRSDGNLEVSEVFGLKINADMVVLSACQTGLGKVTSGDDVIGLNRAFFYAGTHTVISSLWRVSDISTAVMIKQFYRQYRLHDKADSLRLAILHVKNRYPHPGYWGAFTLVGDYY